MSPMLPSWMRSRNCRPRLVYFLAIEMTRRRFASTISFFACRASRSPFCTIWTILRLFLDLEARLFGERMDLGAQFLDALLVARDEVLPAARRELGDAVEPARIELRADVVLQEVFARDPVAFGEPHHAPLVADEALVDVVELLDERIDARLIEAQRLHLADDLVLELLVLALLVGRERRALELELDVLVLEPAQPLVGIGDLVEGLEHLGLELGLDRRERHRALEIVLVELALRRLDRLLFLPARRPGLAAERRRGDRRRRRRDGLPLRRGPVAATVARRDRGRILGVGPGIGRFEIDDVAQENLAVVELVAPDDDRLEGQRALAQARDHRLAAGLDALRDRDFALAGEQLDRAHLAQIHAHGIVGALAGLGLLGLGRGAARNLDELALALLLLGLLARLFAAGLLGLGLFGLDDVDAHLVEHREDVLELLGIDLFHQRVDLVVGDVAG